MNQKLSVKERLSSNWASAAALVLSLLGAIFYALLVSASFESTESPAIVLGLTCAAAVLSAVCLLWKDLFHALSTAAFFTALGALGAFVAGRVSYLAFYLSGDVMNTGLSPFFLLSAVLLVLAVLFTALAIGQPFDGENRVRAGRHLILAVVAIAVILAVGLAVVQAIMGSATPAAPGPGSTPTGTQAPTEESSAPAASQYKTPTEDPSHWQSYTPEQYAQEDVSGKNAAYQFTASIVDNGRETNLLINLYEDGFVRIFQYSGAQLTYEYNGYWRNRDDEGLYFGVSNYVYQGESNPSYGVEPGDIATVDYSYDLTAQDGMFSFGCNFCLGFADGGQFVRSMMVEGDGAPAYAAAEDYAAELSAASGEASASEEESSGEEEEAVSYPENTMLLTFIPDTSEKLETTFHCESSVWGPALGQTGSYTPGTSADLLFSWSNEVDTYKLDFMADGTFTYQFTTMGITESGTWTFDGWTLTTTTAGGLTATAQLVKG